MQRIEELNVENLKIIQDDSLYCFTSDAVLLSRFATVKKGDVVADFCSGSGIVGLHLYGLNKDKIKRVTLFEMQEELFSASVKSIQLNGLQDTFTAVNKKVQEISGQDEKFSLIVCNPPYQKVGSGDVQEDIRIARCRTEIDLTLEELVSSVSRALKYGGRFSMVHRADRLVDVCFIMRQNNIEPKRLQFVYSGKNEEPYLLLIEGVKGGKPNLKILKGIRN